MQSSPAELLNDEITWAVEERSFLSSSFRRAAERLVRRK